jgi:hypothetical protein
MRRGHADLFDVSAAVNKLTQQIGNRTVALIDGDPSVARLSEGLELGDRGRRVFCDLGQRDIGKRPGGIALDRAQRLELFPTDLPDPG